MIKSHCSLSLLLLGFLVFPAVRSYAVGSDDADVPIQKCEAVLKSTTYQRFLLFMAAIKKDGSVGSTLDERVASYIKNDTRGNVFRLQGMLRIFAKHEKYGEDFEKGYKKVRNFEDNLGRYIDSLKFRNRAVKLGLNHLEKAVAERLAHDEDALYTFMKDDWNADLESRWPEKFEKRFDQITGSAEREFVISEVAKFIKDVQTREYDLTKLQEGVHEYRRKLRWILLMFQGAGGLFETKATPELDKKYERYLKGSNVRDAEFSKIRPIYPQKKPCQISQTLVEMLTLAVFQVGEGKDSGELAENIARAYLDSKLESDEAVAMELGMRIAKAQPGYIDPFKIAVRWKKTLDKEDILALIRGEVEACL